MTEDEINKLPIDKLFDLMIKCTGELITLTHSIYKSEYEKKKKEVQLLQRAIIAKRAEFPPG